MFSGIVEETGITKRILAVSGLSVLEISAEKIFEDTKIGDSILVNGVCLTVEKIDGRTFTVSLSKQTIRETSLGGIKPGTHVNLERALKVSDRLGGHILTGHIDFKTPLRSLYKQGADVVIRFNVPVRFERYVVERGSIGVDGISFTVAELKGSEVTIFIIPYTLSSTNLKYRKNGDILNIETDINAKYIEKILLQQNKKTVDEKEVYDERF